MLMRFALFGTGSIGRRHLHNLLTLAPGARPVFVRADRRTDALSKHYGAEVVEDVTAAIDRGIDLAIVATPSSLHAAPTAALLRAGVPTYIEKPVVTCRADLDALDSLLRSLVNPPPTLCGCNLRFLPSLALLRRRLLDGDAGHVVRVQLQAGQWLPDWRPQQDYRASYSARDDDGGVVFDLIHELDMARWLFGEFDTVHAVGGHYSELDIDSEDAAAILLGRRHGPVVAIGLDYVARAPIRRYEVVGDRATLSWDLHRHELLRSSAQGSAAIEIAPDAFDVPTTYVIALRTLLDSMRSGEPTGQDLAEGLRSARLALDAVDKLRA